MIAKPGMEQPVYYWDPVIAPSGLAFYRGNLFPAWKHSAFAGGLRGIGVYRLEMKARQGGGGRAAADRPEAPASAMCASGRTARCMC